MKNLKIAVTGGAGFIGTNLLQELKKRYIDAEIISIDIRNPQYPVSGIKYELCDVRLKDRLFTPLNSSNKIFHLAALIGTHESFDNPSEVFETNIGGVLNILDFVKRNPQTELFVAGMPGIWNNPYSISKDAAVRMALAYYETYLIKVSILRWYSVYGPYQYINRYNKAVPTFITKALNNEPLPVFGNGNQTSDFIYVQDAVNLAIDSLENRKWGKVIQCASGKGITVNQLVNKIIKLCKSSSKVAHLPMRIGEPENAYVVADTEELKKHYSRKPITLDEGLSKTITFYQQTKILD
ncbi:hypothetical protein COT50_00750 [candidate division WWE3 bacterium CG08_land_8_20_14_0_20_41_10]|uniref:NAD-dependent epimerase/dehydratase domain-containing protein n=1 Tax=candidate division WWE3 bacterium CG08_land_8_20_14_0_20_41_10 TaxID=1975085 RepID=A0A2H0XCQ6_UNCKA|nr:MAG: hypothetical protein COT50_00750 [candidate division WWE3 bacterium CG08_land_8_20_14_0_20_41_10]